jgi:hypothetical protein
VEGLLANRPLTAIWLVTDAVRAIHADAADGLLADWRGRGVRMVTSEEIVGRGALRPHLEGARV